MLCFYFEESKVYEAFGKKYDTRECRLWGSKLDWK